MPKPRIPNQRKANIEHKKRTERYVQLIQQVYDRIANEAARRVAMTGYDPAKSFSFDNYPETREAIKQLQTEFISNVGAIIMSGTSAEWKESNLVQDLVAKKVLTAYTGTSRSGEEFERYFETNPDSLKAFQQRRENGMRLSDRVWNLSEQYKAELETAIESAIAPGRSAQLLSQDVRKFLNEPDLMFRRFRYKDDNGCWRKKWKKRVIDEDGKIRFIDCDRDSYRNQWTGPGYYKSSYKNAMRLARTEINMAYRTAEQKRWEQFDFVVGYEVKTTQNSKHETDICDELAGKYPKSFHFVGWHPHCLCYCIPILKTEDEFWSLDDDAPSRNEVKDVPQGFRDWIVDNKTRVDNARDNKKEPYFIRDNKEIVDHALKYAKIIKVGDTEISVRDMVRECTVIPTDNGKVYIHPNHGNTERVENINFAKWRANHFGEDVILLPNPNDIKTADSYNITRCVTEEYKRGKTPTLNAFDRLIRDAKEQANYIIIEPDCDISPKLLSEAIVGRVKRAANLKELRIKIGESEALYTRNDILSKGFKIKPEDFDMPSGVGAQSRKGVEPNIISNADVKLINFFDTTKFSKRKSISEIASERHAKRDMVQIRTDWANRKVNQLWDAINKGLLPKECTNKINELKDDILFGDFDIFNRKAKGLYEAVKRHQKDRIYILTAWEERKLSRQQSEDIIEKIHGIKKGNLQSIEEVFGKVNPDYDPKNAATSKNCSSCTYAAELRMRGYDVTAAHRQNRIPATLEEEYKVRHQIGYNIMRSVESPTMQRATSSGAYGWIDPTTGEPPVAIRFNIPKGAYDTRIKELRESGLNMNDALKKYHEELKALRIKELKTIIPEDGRYDIMVTWKSGGGHSMMLIKEGDEFNIYCHQTKRRYTISEIFNSHAVDKPLRVLRIDNLTIDADKVKGLVRVNGVDLRKKELDELLASTDFSELKKKMGSLWMEESDLKSYLRNKEKLKKHMEKNGKKR